MTIQEEIRKGIDNILAEFFVYSMRETLCGSKDVSHNKYLARDQILSYLHSQGVVIEVKMELPLQVACYKCHEKFDFPNEGLLKAGYVAVEPLIKE